MKAIRELIRVLLDMPANSVRPANQNAPTGGKSDQFATVLVTAKTRQGWDMAVSEDAASPSLQVVETVGGLRRLTASVQFFRGDALAKAEKLTLRLHSATAIGMMAAENIGLVSISSVRDLTAVIDTYHEERAQVVLDFNVTVTDVTNVDTFGTFPITVTTPDETTTFEVISP